MTADNNEHLFNQLDDILNASLKDDIEDEVEEVLAQQEMLHSSRDIFDIFLEEHPAYTDLYNRLYGKDPHTLDSLMDALHGVLKDNPSTEEFRVAHNLSAILTAIEFISFSRQYPELSSKAEVQINILTDDWISPDQKSTFVAIAANLLEGETLDITDPDDVLAAIHKQSMEMKENEINKAMYRKIAVVFDTEFINYHINYKDPVYQLLKGLATLQLRIDSLEWDSHLRSVSEYLRVLGITPEDYIKHFKNIQAAIAD